MKFTIARDEKITAWKRAIYEVEADDIRKAVDMVLTDENSKGFILENTITTIPGSVEVYDISSNK